MTAAAGAKNAERRARIVRVAVIDSGVHADHPHIGGVSGGAGIDEHGGVHGDFIDRLGHGTAVTAAIREKAPAAELFAIKVFDRELTATARALVAACDYALSVNAHVINMSLGTSNAQHEPALIEAVKRFSDRGAIVIAAGEQDGVRWLPGSIAGVWAVTLDWMVPRDTCKLMRLNRNGAQLSASGYPRPIPGVPPDRNLKGLSFAVANVTGIVTALLADDEDEDAASVVTRAFARGWGH